MKTINVYTNCENTEKSLSHYYDIVDHEESIEMYNSSNTSWTFPNKKIITCLEDTMKGEYKIEINGKKIKLNYSEAYELFILLGILNKEDKIEYRESKVIKSI